MRWLEIYLKIKIRNIRQKKKFLCRWSKTAENGLSKVFFRSAYFVQKKIKNNKFWMKENQYNLKLNSPKVRYS